MGKFALVIILLTAFCSFAAADNEKGLFSTNYFKKIQKMEKSSQALSDESQTKDWSIMIYGCLDAEEGIESGFLKEFYQIAGFGNAQGKAHIAAQLDFRTASKRETSRYYLKKDELHVRGKFANVNTGNPETLSSFLAWAMQYPANHRMLFILGHGTGWMSLVGPGSITAGNIVPGQQKSFGYDHGSEDCLTLTEAGAIFEQVLGSKKIDILAFRSCLMNQVETALQLEPFFNYFVASQSSQVTINEGFLTTILGVEGGFETDILQCIASGDASPVKTARAMYTSLLKTNTKITDLAKMDFEIACLDLPKLKQAVSMIKPVFAQLSTDLKTKPETTKELLASARKDTPKFGGMFEGMYTTKPDDYEYIDLGVLLAGLGAKGFMPEETAACCAAIEEAVIAKRNGSDRAGSFATAIFMFPTHEKLTPLYQKLIEGFYAKLDFCTQTSWDEVLHAYYGL
ncbi:MAG: clostripain-related cysteine peptidase [Candidatus Wallbacteria bacterium]|nr:clostripain-related cysteine peptidase [Candidatus Wallbacteria bacterium]